MDIVEYLAQGVFLSEKDFLSYVNTMPRRYKQFTVKKRNGEDRLIAQPARTVKTLQMVVVSLLKNHLNIHEAAMAYVKGKSIKDNANAHVQNKFILKMDFRNFFLSIKPDIFLACIEKQGLILSDQDKMVLSNLFFWKLRRNSSLRLSIGAPSSPFVSNVTMFFFDELISKICKDKGIVYTRYADDLSFSTNQKDILFSIPALVKESLKVVGLKNIKVNNAKTVFSSKKFNRHVTGITLSNEGVVSLGRERKRSISAMVHHFTLGLLDKESIYKLKGYLGFAKYIEPSFVLRLKIKYGDEVVLKIQKFND
ncbi:retron St85 family RNA-directed DNA polymerase [Pantoea agglomerans]|uniref:retron St85 family RNA-directed DNA polymerase n=1 Tax=Enterobacter agglomerans TaxID=549 RepID=UPI000501551B|nr:retron St85 family RNA-directed DNA polymerase [Pantoea agglomerans]KYN66110.1 RNA-dependent DNA polymerase [Pantoea agglomerans]